MYIFPIKLAMGFLGLGWWGQTPRNPLYRLGEDDFVDRKMGSKNYRLWGQQYNLMIALLWNCSVSHMSERYWLLNFNTAALTSTGDWWSGDIKKKECLLLNVYVWDCLALLFSVLNLYCFLYHQKMLTQETPYELCIPTSLYDFNKSLGLSQVYMSIPDSWV